MEAEEEVEWEIRDLGIGLHAFLVVRVRTPTWRKRYVLAFCLASVPGRATAVSLLCGLRGPPAPRLHVRLALGPADGDLTRILADPLELHLPTLATLLAAAPLTAARPAWRSALCRDCRAAYGLEGAAGR